MAENGAVDQLHALFPHILKATIRATLSTAKGNADLAAEKLLELKSPVNSSTKKGRVYSKVGQKAERGSGWSALSSEVRDGDSNHQKPFSYVSSQGNKIAPDIASNYPELPSTQIPRDSSIQRNWGSRPSTRTATPKSRQSPWMSSSSGEASPYRPNQRNSVDPHLLAKDLSRRLSFEAERPAYSLVVGQDSQTSCSDEHLALLQSKFPDTELEIIRESIIASNGNISLAIQLLSSFSSQQPYSFGNEKDRMHANEAKRAPEIGNLVSEEDDPDYLSETDFADKLGKHKVKQKGRRQGGKPNPAVSNRVPQTRSPKHKSMQRQPGIAESSSEDESSITAFQGDTYEEDKSDTYHKYRAEALKLDRKRFRRLRNAAHFYALGEHSNAQNAIKEAKTLKFQAEIAHKQAASQIQKANNQGKDLWELDLHGLHLQEANHALEIRLKEIEDLKLLPDDRRLLRVIVGRGNHSTGGEAILQRAVNSHLLKLSYKIEMRGGCILVHPKKS